MDITSVLHKYYREKYDDAWQDFIYTLAPDPVTPLKVLCIKIVPELGDFYIGEQSVAVRNIPAFYNEITKEEFMEVYFKLDQELRKRMGWSD